MDETGAATVPVSRANDPRAGRVSLRAWLQLFRVPNLFTVPGDPIAGFLLATFGVLTWDAALAVLGTLCLYAGGLVLNDLHDLEEDRRDRPERPLPAGRIAVHAAWIMVSGLFFAGCAAYIIAAGMRGLIISGLLLAAIVAYNCVTKAVPIIGPLNMGVCRGLSVYAGGVAAYETVFPRTTGLLVMTTITTLYFAAITNLARHEVRQRVPPLAKLWPVLIAFAGVVVLTHGIGPFYISPATACFTCGFLLVLRETVLLFRTGAGASPLPARIGALIRIALVFQAAFCVAILISRAGWICAIGLLIAFPVSSGLSRRFYAS